MKKISIVKKGNGRSEMEVDPNSDVWITTETGNQFVIYVRDEGITIRETTGDGLTIHPTASNSILIK